MSNEEYLKFIKNYAPKENRFKNIIVAFLAGGSISLFAELLTIFLMIGFGLSNMISGIITGIIIVFITSLLTALGFFDDIVMKLKCGVIIPTTGFAHCITASALDYKKDGLITGLGSNFFKLAGSVILYGIISSFVLVVGRVILGV